MGYSGAKVAASQGSLGERVRQGLVVFSEPASAGPEAVEAVAATVQAGSALGPAWVAYADAASSERLRARLGGPPPRFFPQASRPSLGERMAQAFAFVFVQGLERAVLAKPQGQAPSAEALAAALAGLDQAPVVVEAAGPGLWVALRRVDFPHVAAIFEQVRWEQPGAKEAAMLMLDELAAQRGR